MFGFWKIIRSIQIQIQTQNLLISAQIEILKINRIWISNPTWILTLWDRHYSKNYCNAFLILAIIFILSFLTVICLIRYMDIRVHITTGPILPSLTDNLNNICPTCVCQCFNNTPMKISEIPTVKISEISPVKENISAADDAFSAVRLHVGNERKWAPTILAGNLKFVLNTTTWVYELNNKPPLWLYWDRRDSIPDFARILIDAMHCVNPEFETILVHDADLLNYFPDCPMENFHKLSPNHKADVVRTQLMRIYGGVYFDVDTYPVHTNYHYYELLADYDLIGATWHEYPLAIPHLGPGRAGIPLFDVASVWQMVTLHKMGIDQDGAGKKKSNETISKKPKTYTKEGYTFEWDDFMGTLTHGVITHMLRNKALRYYGIRGETTVGQLVAPGLAFDMLHSLAKVATPMNQLDPAPFFYTHHAGQAEKVDKLSVKELLNPAAGNTVFSYFAICALRKCYASDKIDAEKTKLGGMVIRDLRDILNANKLPYNCLEFNETQILPYRKAKKGD